MNKLKDLNSKELAKINGGAILWGIFLGSLIVGLIASLATPTNKN